MIRNHPERQGALMIKKRHAWLIAVMLALVSIGGAACSALGGSVVSAVDATLTVIAAQTINAGSGAEPDAEGTDEPAALNLPTAPDGITFRIIETSPDERLYLIEILWRDLADNEAGYIVLRTFENSGRAPTEVTRVGADETVAEDGRAACGRNYLYYVSAFNSGGISEGACRTLSTPACGSGDMTLEVGDCDPLPGVSRPANASAGGTNGQGAGEGVTPAGNTGSGSGASGGASGAGAGQGSSASSCGDGICAADEQSGDGYCGIDCGAGGGGVPGACGNGTCDVGQGENTHSCPADCTAYPGDGYCDSGETEINSPDCTLLLGYCGDGICEGGETCIDDCGIQSDFCGDGLCTGNENAFNCADDCGSGPQGGGPGSLCGNGQLDPGEQCESHDDCQQGFYCGSDCGCQAVATEGYCGDGVVQWYEECEVDVTGPWCSASERCWACNCEYQPDVACGNGSIDSGEVCDTAALPSGCGTGYTCDYGCQSCTYSGTSLCGDGQVTGSEACENDSQCADNFSCDACQCVFNPGTTSVCGNGVIESGENCEFDSDCSPNFVCGGCECIYNPPYECGNGIVEPGEQCDSSSSTCGTNEYCTADCVCTP